MPTYTCIGGPKHGQEVTVPSGVTAVEIPFHMDRQVHMAIYTSRGVSMDNASPKDRVLMVHSSLETSEALWLIRAHLAQETHENAQSQVVKDLRREVDLLEEAIDEGIVNPDSFCSGVCPKGPGESGCPPYCEAYLAMSRRYHDLKETLKKKECTSGQADDDKEENTVGP